MSDKNRKPVPVWKLSPGRALLYGISSMLDFRGVLLRRSLRVSLDTTEADLQFDELRARLSALEAAEITENNHGPSNIRWDDWTDPLPSKLPPGRRDPKENAR
jgi:hypothetical protein